MNWNCSVGLACNIANRPVSLVFLNTRLTKKFFSSILQLQLFFCIVLSARESILRLAFVAKRPHVATVP